MLGGRQLKRESLQPDNKKSLAWLAADRTTIPIPRSLGTHRGTLTPETKTPQHLCGSGFR